MERKWHKSRVKLNVLTVSKPLWPCSAPPLSPVWVHHSSAEWGLLAQHLCQTTATLASAPASPSFCRSAPPGPQAWLITRIIQDCTVAWEQSAHFTTSGASVHYSAYAASLLAPDQIHDKWGTVDSPRGSQLVAAFKCNEPANDQIMRLFFLMERAVRSGGMVLYMVRLKKNKCLQKHIIINSFIHFGFTLSFKHLAFIWNQ